MFFARPEPEVPGPGQESVWDFPRPAIAEPTTRLLEVDFGGVTIASTRRGVRVLETSHPPGYYLPRDDVRMGCLQPLSAAGSMCEWKGAARYFDVVVGEHRAQAAAWTYPSPTPTFAILKDHIAFYPSRMQACRVDGERALPQQGVFYGGWITADLAGPFKGAPGSRGW